ncbi:EscU/YscU/HrcU family type III secretion system export apparatus switch protein [Desulfosediminicola ganghwensis]|uniref:EscU/YscU/HrcU family type III secretion system export apparatus switch protein n=1 Tax=Desulfosediminicola ganghwensis TaxID=2569540 RepID=UPI0010ABD959|nr:EscU/YscU/HrcU family type III secretion system export apparatus switch protein [Desulfosediminicola ganghwensis]
MAYDQLKDSAPKIIANARGNLALKLLSHAKASGVQIHHNLNLVELLSKLPSGEEIPPDLCQANAEILAFVYQVSERLKDK